MVDAAQKPGKARGRPFTGKGDPRNNLGGRPAGYAAYREKMRVHSDEAIAALVADLEVPEKRAFAAKTILEFSWGKAPAAPDDLEALRDSGINGWTAAQVLELAKTKEEGE